MRFSQVFQFALSLQRIAQLARDELAPLLSGIDWEDEGARGTVKLLMGALLEKYGTPAAELGTEWYDLCAEDAEQGSTRIVGQLPQGVGQVGMDVALDSLFDRRDALDMEIEDALAGLMVDYVKKSARSAILGNLAEDQEQYELLGTRYSRRRYGNVAPGFCSVPTGDTTCAYCIMQASRGYALYSDFKQKFANDRSNMWHDDCDCVVVPYADASSIEGYDRYEEYRDMYEGADDLYRRVQDGTASYPPDLQERIDGLAGRTDTAKGTRERLVVMRYLYGLEH